MPETTGFVVQGRKPPNRENASAHFFALRANFYILRSRVALPMGPKPTVAPADPKKDPKNHTVYLCRRSPRNISDDLRYGLLYLHK